MLNTEERKTYHLPLKILFSVLILVALTFLFYSTIKPQEIDETYLVATSIHPSYFFESNTFTDAIERVKSSDKKYPKTILGGVVPHHLLPSFIVADFFKNLAKQNPKTVILIGPNHYELGGKPALSSTAGWETPFGIVEPDTEIIKDLYDKDIVAFNEEVLDNEHSIGGIAPFIKYYIPEAKIVPIIISRALSMEEIKRMVNNIESKINKDIVIIASVDFSHYQIKNQAEANDQITLDLMKSKDYQNIMNLSSAYIDSPQSIITLLMVMEKKGIEDFSLIYHTNAGEILRDTSHEVTSYFSFVF